LLKKLYNELVIQALITVVSVIVLGFAVVVRGNANDYEQTVPPVLSDTTTATDTPTSTPEPTMAPVETLVPTATPTATVKPTAAAFKVSATEQDWLYPGARIIQTLPELKTEITIDPKVVTDWYKEKIKSLGMSTQSFIVTSTNDKIYNKLVAASAASKIEVTIERVSSSAATQITVVTSSTN
jgi:hypothetical protein